MIDGFKNLCNLRLNPVQITGENRLEDEWVSSSANRGKAREDARNPSSASGDEARGDP